MCIGEIRKAESVHALLPTVLFLITNIFNFNTSTFRITVKLIASPANSLCNSHPIFTLCGVCYYCS